MASLNGVVLHWLALCLVVLFLVMALAGLAVGIGLIVSAPRTLEISRIMNRWVSTRRVLQSVDVPRDTDGVSHRHHRWVAAGFMLGGLVSIFGLAAGFDVPALSAVLAKGSSVPVLAVGLQSIKWFLVLGSAFGVGIGAMLLFYPNAEAALEKFANRWVSSRRVVRNWDDMHLTLDRLVEAHPMPAGWVIACTSAAAVVYGIVLLARP